MIKSIWSHADKVGKQAVFPDFPLDETLTVDDIAKDSRISSLKQQMFNFLESEKYGDYDTMVEAIRREYDDQDEADSKIRSWLNTKYGKQYKEAYRKYLETGEQKYASEMIDIEELLDNATERAGLNAINYSAWQTAVDKEDKQD